MRPPSSSPRVDSPRGSAAQSVAAHIGAHDKYPRHLFALGYGGNGMTFGFLAARLLLDWYRGDRSSDHRLFAFDRQRRQAMSYSDKQR